MKHEQTLVRRLSEYAGNVEVDPLRFRPGCAEYEAPGLQKIDIDYTLDTFQ